MAHIHRTGPTELIWVPVKLTSSKPTSTIKSGDLVAFESNTAVPAQLFTWTTDLATTQTAFAAAFLGMSTGVSRAGVDDPRDLELPVIQDGNVEFDCDSATYAIGSYIACKKDTGNNLLQQVQAVATKARAIAVVVKDHNAATTRVLARLINSPIKR